MNQISVSSLESSKRVAFNLICNTASHFLSAVIAFFITPFLIEAIGVEAYSFYPISTELVAFFSIFSGIVNATASRYVTVEDARGNTADAGRYFSTVFFANVFLSAVLLIPMGLFVGFADRILSVPLGFVGELRIFLSLVFVSVIVNALASAFACAYSITNRIDLLAGQDFIAVLLKAAVLFALLGGGFTSSIVSVGVAMLLSNVAGAVIQFLMCRRLTPHLVLSVKKVSWLHAKRVLVSGFWYSLNRLGAFLMAGVLLLISGVIFSGEDVGVYSVSLTASRFLNGVLLMLAGVFLPVTTKRFARGEDALLRRDVIRNQKITGYFAAVGSAIGIGFCDAFFGLWIPAQNSPLLRTLTVLSILPLVSVACALPIMDLGVVMNRMRRLSLYFVAGGLLNLAAILFVAYFTKAGVIGVSLLSSGAQLLWYAVAVPLFGGRLLRGNVWHFYRPVLRCFLAFGVSLGIIFAVKTVAPVQNWLSLCVMVALTAVAALAVGFLCVFGKPKFKI